MGSLCIKEGSVKSKNVSKQEKDDHTMENNNINSETTKVESKMNEEKAIKENTMPRTELSNLKKFSKEEVENSETLMMVDGYVVETAGFQEEHPGGKRAIEQYRKKDATLMFMSSHSHYGAEKLMELVVGQIDGYPNVGEKVKQLL
ncbi:hypothetical protein C9374_005046 [Naegleria lovaniensis]|uniref:Cytochrome b5 heme-binding domain-containing protein n=1 Tax=Naegleria lovaniensis TaxID=51637 RepID=A0AA88GNK7_NAELO|nr:uncharacterized protein C9374_005046 [Naegleria lovaniensis]KAG2382466.1 hypothetical protein C9374_005046 [Naegleria lovaniensis]